RPQDHITLEMAPLEIRHRSVRPISAKHAQASRFLQQSPTARPTNNARISSAHTLRISPSSFSGGKMPLSLMLSSHSDRLNHCSGRAI
ncbi:hypothetical protein EKH49_11930, partial [Glutamicibacter sp. HZAU]